MNARRSVVLQWQLGMVTGWGIYGLNLALAWRDDPEIEPLCSVLFHHSLPTLDELRRHALAGFISASEALQARIRNYPSPTIAINAPVLAAVGNGLGCVPSVDDKWLVGEPTVGLVFFENSNFDAQAMARARNYKVLVAGSTWNRQVLEAHGLHEVRALLQGVDTTLFHPAPRFGILRDRFAIFSGGKLEYRKGQDLVLLAFRAFARKHPEAILVTAWHSLWPETAKEFDTVPGVHHVPFNSDGRPDMKGWALANGVSEGQFLDLGLVSNAAMPQILREMDVALFPNRCEGGTNLVAMECMACGIPVVLAKNTGHLDLIQEGNCFVLERQRPVAGRSSTDGTAGWGESDVDEMVDALESVWADRNDATRRAGKAAEMMAAMTWRNTADQLRGILTAAVA